MDNYQKNPIKSNKNTSFLSLRYMVIMPNAKFIRLAFFEGLSYNIPIYKKEPKDEQKIHS